MKVCGLFSKKKILYSGKKVNFAFDVFWSFFLSCFLRPFILICLSTFVVQHYSHSTTIHCHFPHRIKKNVARGGKSFACYFMLNTFGKWRVKSRIEAAKSFSTLLSYWRKTSGIFFSISWRCIESFLCDSLKGTTL